MRRERTHPTTVKVTAAVSRVGAVWCAPTTVFCRAVGLFKKTLCTFAKNGKFCTRNLTDFQYRSVMHSIRKSGTYETHNPQQSPQRQIDTVYCQTATVEPGTV